MSQKEKLYQFYNQSEEYFELTEQGHRREIIFPIHREILNKCRERNGLLIDLGCGTGLDTLAMSGQNNFCLGIDISGLAIKKARIRAENKKNVKFRRSDLENLPLEDRSVKTITSFYTFEHLFNPEKVLSEVDRVLIKKGELFLLCPSFASPFRNAPVFGGVRKIRILKKMILSLIRIFSVRILRKRDFKVKMIDESLIDFNKIGKDLTFPSEMQFSRYNKYL